MAKTRLVTETELAVLAGKHRVATGMNRAEAARDLGVARQAVIYAEDQPKKSLAKLRRRMIEKYGKAKVTGPWYQVEEK